MQIYSVSNNGCSFKAMKKSQFTGINHAVVEKFKAPIEKFDTMSDFQSWAQGLVNNIKESNFGGRYAEVVAQRTAMLKEWVNYVTKENEAYTPAIALLILAAITKSLKPNNDDIPPTLNKGVLSDCVSEIDKNSSVNPKYSFNFNKMYQTKLKASLLNTARVTDNTTGWIEIPSKTNDPDNFESNVEKLKALSHKNWCTKSFNAENYLSEGDFHIYMENGVPKLGVRFDGDKVEEIQGELNNSKIPIAYLDTVKEHIAQEKLSLSNEMEEAISDREKIVDEVSKIKEKINPYIKDKDYKSILEYFGMKVTDVDDEGFLTLEKFCIPEGEITFDDLGISENEIFKHIKKINGNADFKDSSVTNLGSLEEIGGHAYFRSSNVKTLANLKYIGENAVFTDSKVEDLGALEEIGGKADFVCSWFLTSLGNLKRIGDNAQFQHSEIKDLGNLEEIGGCAYFNSSCTENLGNLRYIGKQAVFKNSAITSLGNLEEIAGYADFSDSNVKDLGSLKILGDGYNIENSPLTEEDMERFIIDPFDEINEEDFFDEDFFNSDDF